MNIVELLPKRLTSLILLTSISIACSFMSSSSLAATPLLLGRYKVSSETTDQWTTNFKANEKQGFEILAAYVDKSDASRRLFAFRKNEKSNQACDEEFNYMRQQKIAFDRISAPKGWDCAYENKAEQRLYAMRPYRVKGKALQVEFATVFVGQKIDRERFLKILNSTQLSAAKK